MQKAIYLLQEMGVPVSDYGFSWYKHGPYSQALLDDAYSASSHDSVINLSALSSDNRRAIEELKVALKTPCNTNYCSKDWCECLASLHYLRQNVLPRSCSDSDVLSMLIQRKPHLNDKDANTIALQRIKQLFT